MKLKLGALILSLLLIINIILGILIFADIQLIHVPTTKITLAITDINQDHIVLVASISLYNPNSLPLSVKNLKLQTHTPDNTSIGTVSFKGGTVQPDTTRVFTTNATLGFQTNQITPVHSTVTGDIGIHFLGFIKKTLPFEVTIETSVDHVLSSFAAPDIHLDTTIDELTADGIAFSGELVITNPNPFSLEITDINTQIFNQNKATVGTLTLQDIIISPLETIYNPIHGMFSYAALDSGTLSIMFTADAGAQIAGYHLSRNITTTAAVPIPDIASFILSNNSFEFTLSSDFNLKVRGLDIIIGLRVFNPSKIPLEFNNLICQLNRLDGNTTTTLGEKPMESCMLAPNTTICKTTSLLIPYATLLTTAQATILPDWFQISISGHFTIYNTTQQIPIVLNGILEPHVLRNQ